MEVALKIFKFSERLPKIGEGILYVRDDGFFQTWNVGTVERSCYITEFRREYQSEKGFTIEIRSRETEEPFNEDSYPYVEVGSHTLNEGSYALLSDIQLDIP